MLNEGLFGGERGDKCISAVNNIFKNYKIYLREFVCVNRILIVYFSYKFCVVVYAIILLS